MNWERMSMRLQWQNHLRRYLGVTMPVALPVSAMEACAVGPQSVLAVVGAPATKVGSRKFRATQKSTERLPNARVERWYLQRVPI